MPSKRSVRRAGFTLIELVVVMAIVALLVALAAPRYFHSIDRSKETVLKANLAQTRDAIDKFYGDSGRYPESLDMLVEKKYLRGLPYDPLTDSKETWLIVQPKNSDSGGVYDLHSGAEGNGSDGTSYASW